MTLNCTGGSGAAPMLGRKRFPPLMTAEASWFGKAPCGSCAMTGSMGSAIIGSGQKVSFGGGAVSGSSVSEAERRAVRREAGVGERRERDVRDRRPRAARERADDALPRVVERLLLAVDQPREEVRDEDGLVVVLLVVVVGDRDGPRVAADLDRVDHRSRRRVDHRHGSRRVVGDEEELAVRRERAAARLGADGDLRHDAEAPASPIAARPPTRCRSRRWSRRRRCPWRRPPRSADRRRRRPRRAASWCRLSSSAPGGRPASSSPCSRRGAGCPSWPARPWSSARA